jgi:hypothetical protein
MTQKQPRSSTSSGPAQSASRTPGSAAHPANQSTRANRAPDAIALLTDDHQRVQKMFKEFEALGDADSATKQELAERICIELTIHTAIEEEIFYPAARAAIDDDDLMDEADVEHDAAKELVAQIQDMDPEESHYDAKVKVLGEEVEHHVKEEQDKMFPKVKKSDLDLKALGEEMAARKAELQQEIDEE